MQEIFEKLKNNFPNVEQNVLLKNYCTFHIGGMADYFLEVGDGDELKKVIFFCKDNNIKFYIIGGGSNILVSDNGYKGLIIIYRKKFKEHKIQENEFEEIGQGKFKIELDASFLLADIVGQMMDIGFSGFEWAAGIPGTLGGAINGNAGAFGGTISDDILGINVLKIKDGTVETSVFSKSDCKFAYRSSIFKTSQDFIIVSAAFVLEKKDKEIISEKVSDILKKRLGKHPKGYSAGSVFKNYEGEVNKKLFKKYPELQAFSEKGIVPIGYLIEQCGLKGTRIGDAQISPDHANFIINLDGAKSDNVLKLISLIKREVKEKFEIEICEEIKYLG